MGQYILKLKLSKMELLIVRQGCLQVLVLFLDEMALKNKSIGPGVSPEVMDIAIQYRQMDTMARRAFAKFGLMCQLCPFLE